MLPELRSSGKGATHTNVPALFVEFGSTHCIHDYSSSDPKPDAECDMTLEKWMALADSLRRLYGTVVP